MRSKLFAVSVVVMAACNTKQPPYLKHKLVKAEKLSGGCEAYRPALKMESSIIGERYQFQNCLPAAYDGRCRAERHGDTVALRFAAANAPKALYNIVMDIDTCPPYHYLTIDDVTFTLIPTQN